MTPQGWFKSSDMIELRQGVQPGLLLINRTSRSFVTLTEQQASAWESWDCEGVNGALSELASAGLVFQAPSLPAGEPSALDEATPSLPQRARWYEESPGMAVLFRRDSVQTLVLGPYATHCWKRMAAGATIGEMRISARRIFNRDEVIPILRSLMGLGWIDPVAGLDGRPPYPGHILRELYVPGIHYWLPHTSIPWSCDWELNTVCNLRCVHCYLPDHAQQGLELDTALEVADALAAAGIPYVNLLGGEVLLRKDLERIVERLRNGGVYVSMVSNGVLLTAERARALAEAGVQRLMLSLDGMNASVHDAIRGAGNFERTTRGIQNALDAGIPNVAIVWTVHTGNVSELPAIPAGLKALGLSEVCIDVFKKTGVLGSKAAFEPIDNVTINAISATIAQWTEADPSLTVHFEPHCTCGRTRLTIGAKGEIRLCTFQPKPAGWVGRVPILDLWRASSPGFGAVGPVGYCASNPRVERRGEASTLAVALNS